MSYISLNDGSGHTCTVPYATLRSLLFEKSTAAVPGVTRGPGNPAAWLEFAPEVMQSGVLLCISPSGVSFLTP